MHRSGPGLLDRDAPRPSSAADNLREAFDGVRDLTIGIEEELVVLDPETLAPVSAPESLFAGHPGEPRVKRELWRAQAELVTGVCETPREAAAELSLARRSLHAALGGLRLAGLGVHPFAPPWIAVSPGERYADLVHRHRLGARVGGLPAGL